MTQRSLSAGECFACGRPLTTNPYQVTCADDQQVTVGSECFAQIRRAGHDGWQPPKGGPRLYLLRCKPGADPNPNSTNAPFPETKP